MTHALLLAGDIGGTKTLLGLYETALPRPRQIATGTFATLDHADLPSMIAGFLAGSRVERRIESACFGVAGPVFGAHATLTNVGWQVDAHAVAARFGLARVALLNDLQAMAYAVPVLEPAETCVLQEGRPVAGGNIALIAAGTGLGEALLHNIGGRFVPSPSEGGHADFAARSERDIAVLRDLIGRFGRAEVEHVVSGRGLVNVWRVTHAGPCAAAIDPAGPDAPAAISTAAFDRRCAGCVEALDLFVEAYGAEAGNLALRVVATGGVFVGGGIAPKILPALERPTFMRAFRAKSPFEALVAAVPVKVILNAESGLLGAAVYAAQCARPDSKDR